MNEKVVPAGGDRHRAPDENPLVFFLKTLENYNKKVSNITTDSHFCDIMEIRRIDRTSHCAFNHTYDQVIQPGQIFISYQVSDSEIAF